MSSEADLEELQGIVDKRCNTIEALTRLKQEA
jgi:hypothetical protein